ncbi:MAG: C1 family peptidase [Bacilli bacterium]
MKEQLCKQDITALFENYEKDSKLKNSQRTVSRNGILESAIDDVYLKNDYSSFSIDLDSGDITNQKRSGRCWMFGGLNVLRAIAIRKLNVKNIEFSQAYLQFFDKLEKANFFLEKVIELIDEPYDSRLNVFALDSMIQDGGHFVMFSNLVKKYGIVPIEFMGETKVSSDTGELNKILSSLLAKDMMILRNRKAEGVRLPSLRNLKEVMMKDIFKVIAVSLGLPVTEFTYQYKDKKDKFVRMEKMTPVEFFNKVIGTELDDYIPLGDAKLPMMKDNTSYTSEYVNNVIGGKPVIFFNVPNSVVKNAVVESLKAKECVWFGSDVGAQSLRKEGKLIDGIYKLDDLFDVDFSMSKYDRLAYRSSFCTHAMTFTGVNLDEKGNPTRFKVENSWGKENGKDGYFVMSDKWFDEYVYQVFVNKKFVPEEYLKSFEASKPVEISPFDTLFMKMD